MRKNVNKVLSALTALGLAAVSLTSCGIFEEKPVHKHRVQHIEEIAATCATDGLLEHDQCIYCKQVLVDGKETSAEYLKIPADTENHGDLREVPGIAATCTTDGVKAYQVCDDCGKTLLDGEEFTDMNSLVIKASGSHTFANGEVECAGCDAYKLLYNGNYYLVDADSKVSFATNDLAPNGTHTYVDKQTYYDALIANPGTFATQTASGQTIKMDENVIKATNTAVGNAFTRFIPTKEDGSAYVGRFLLTYDMTADADLPVTRMGAKIADRTATAYADQSILLGSNTSEEGNADRKLEAGVTYTFAYAMETTAADQLVQMFICMEIGSFSISNVHVIPLTEEAILTEGGHAQLLSFDKAENIAIKKEDCTHAWEEKARCWQCGYEVAHTHVYTDVAEISATCTNTGVAAHQVCDECEKRFVGGVEKTLEELTIGVISTAHVLKNVEEVKATCTTGGVMAHGVCQECDKIFVDGVKKTEEQLKTPAGGAHSFGENGVQCANCDAWKVLYQGNSYLVDGENGVEISATKGVPGYVKADKEAYIASAFENRFTMGSQLNNANNTTVSVENGKYIVTNKEGLASAQGVFTRMAVADSTGKAYIGRFLLVFDVEGQNAEGGALSLDRVGVKVADNTATVNGSGYLDQSVLFGSNNGEEGKERLLEAGVTYRMVYVLETTAADQLVQIFECFGSGTLTISNMHFVPLAEEAKLTAGGTSHVLYFGTAAGSVFTKENCPHTFPQNDNCWQCGESLAHVHTFNDVAEVPATCSSDGMKAYSECTLCKKLYVGNEEVSKEELVIPALDAHVFEGESLVCKYGDGYKLLYNGNYYVVDDTSRVTLDPNALTPEGWHTATEKQKYYDALIAERMTVATQIGSTAKTSVTSGENAWTIQMKNTSVENAFTRFAVSDKNGAYIGRFLLTFDVNFKGVSDVSRVGAKVADKTATAYDGQSLLFGSHASQSQAYTFEDGVTYTFVYVMETTAADQLVQIFHCFSKGTMTLSNVHFIPLSEQATLTSGGNAQLISLSKAADVALNKEACTHAWKKEDHCYQCGATVA